jgi:hypothetical protein
MFVSIFASYMLIEARVSSRFLRSVVTVRISDMAQREAARIKAAEIQYGSIKAAPAQTARN